MFKLLTSKSKSSKKGLVSVPPTPPSNLSKPPITNSSIEPNRSKPLPPSPSDFKPEAQLPPSVPPLRNFNVQYTQFSSSSATAAKQGSQNYHRYSYQDPNLSQFSPNNNGLSNPLQSVMLPPNDMDPYNNSSYYNNNEMKGKSPAPVNKGYPFPSKPEYQSELKTSNTGNYPHFSYYQDHASHSKPSHVANDSHYGKDGNTSHQLHQFSDVLSTNIKAASPGLAHRRSESFKNHYEDQSLQNFHNARNGMKDWRIEEETTDAYVNEGTHDIKGMGIAQYHNIPLRTKKSLPARPDSLIKDINSHLPLTSKLSHPNPNLNSQPMKATQSTPVQSSELDRNVKSQPPLWKFLEDMRKAANTGNNGKDKASSGPTNISVAMSRLDNFASKGPAMVYSSPAPQPTDNNEFRPVQPERSKSTPYVKQSSSKPFAASPEVLETSINEEKDEDEKDGGMLDKGKNTLSRFIKAAEIQKLERLKTQSKRNLMIAKELEIQANSIESIFTQNDKSEEKVKKSIRKKVVKKGTQSAQIHHDTDYFKGAYEGDHNESNGKVMIDDDCSSVQDINYNDLKPSFFPDSSTNVEAYQGNSNRPPGDNGFILAEERQFNRNKVKSIKAKNREEMVLKGQDVKPVRSKSNKQRIRMSDQSKSVTLTKEEASLIKNEDHMDKPESPKPESLDESEVKLIRTKISKQKIESTDRPIDSLLSKKSSKSVRDRASRQRLSPTVLSTSPQPTSLQSGGTLESLSSKQILEPVKQYNLTENTKEESIDKVKQEKEEIFDLYQQAQKLQHPSSKPVIKRIISKKKLQSEKSTLPNVEQLLNHDLAHQHYLNLANQKFYDQNEGFDKKAPRITPPRPCSVLPIMNDHYNINYITDDSNNFNTKINSRENIILRERPKTVVGNLRSKFEAKIKEANKTAIDTKPKLKKMMSNITSSSSSIKKGNSNSSSPLGSISSLAQGIRRLSKSHSNLIKSKEREDSSVVESGNEIKELDNKGQEDIGKDTTRLALAWKASALKQHENMERDCDGEGLPFLNEAKSGGRNSTLLSPSKPRTVLDDESTKFHTFATVMRTFTESPKPNQDNTNDKKESSSHSKELAYQLEISEARIQIENFRKRFREEQNAKRNLEQEFKAKEERILEAHKNEIESIKLLCSRKCGELIHVIRELQQVNETYKKTIEDSHLTIPKLGFSTSPLLKKHIIDPAFASSSNARNDSKTNNGAHDSFSFYESKSQLSEGMDDGTDQYGRLNENQIDNNENTFLAVRSGKKKPEGSLTPLTMYKFIEEQYRQLVQNPDIPVIYETSSTQEGNTGSNSYTLSSFEKSFSKGQGSVKPLTINQPRLSKRMSKNSSHGGDQSQVRIEKLLSSIEKTATAIEMEAGSNHVSNSPSPDGTLEMSRQSSSQSAKVNQRQPSGSNFKEFEPLDTINHYNNDSFISTQSSLNSKKDEVKQLKDQITIKATNHILKSAKSSPSPLKTQLAPSLSSLNLNFKHDNLKETNIDNKPEIIKLEVRPNIGSSHSTGPNYVAEDQFMNKPFHTKAKDYPIDLSGIEKSLKTSPIQPLINENSFYPIHQLNSSRMSSTKSIPNLKAASNRTEIPQSDINVNPNTTLPSSLRPKGSRTLKPLPSLPSKS